MHIFLIAAISVDGFIARKDAESSTMWTSSEDSQWFSRRTKEAGVVVMGRKSYETIPDSYRPLKDRLTVLYTSQAKDGHEIVSQHEWKTSLAPADLIQKLTEHNVTEVAIAGGKQVYSEWMKSGLIQTLYLTIEPVIFGSGIKLFDSEVSGTLQLAQVHELSNNTRVLEYTVAHQESKS